MVLSEEAATRLSLIGSLSHACKVQRIAGRIFLRRMIETAKTASPLAKSLGTPQR